MTQRMDNGSADAHPLSHQAGAAQACSERSRRMVTIQPAQRIRHVALLAHGDIRPIEAVIRARHVTLPPSAGSTYTNVCATCMSAGSTCTSQHALSMSACCTSTVGCYNLNVRWFNLHISVCTKHVGALHYHRQFVQLACLLVQLARLSMHLACRRVALPPSAGATRPPASSTCTPQHALSMSARRTVTVGCYNLNVRQFN